MYVLVLRHFPQPYEMSRQLTYQSVVNRYETNTRHCKWYSMHYSNITMSAIESQITGVSIVCSTLCLGADQRKHASYVALAFMEGIHRSPKKGPVMLKMSSFDDVIMHGHFAIIHVLDYFSREVQHMVPRLFDMGGKSVRDYRSLDQYIGRWYKNTLPVYPCMKSTRR